MTDTIFDKLDDIADDMTDLDNKIITLILANYTYREIAQKVGVHRNTIRYRIRRIRRLLIERGRSCWTE